MKILYVTTISNTVNAFLIPHIKMLIEEGHEVHCAFNIVKEVNEELIKMGCKIHNIEFQRSPLRKENIKAYKKLKKLIQQEKYDLVHTHTPVASACVRLACKNFNNIKVIYTAHGFHFYKGAPIQNWLIYYPIEKWLSKYTDCLITINQEDFQRAKNSFKARRVEYIPSIGLNLDKFKKNTNTRQKIRKELGLTDKDFVVLSVGELNKNKNHATIIKAISKIKEKDIYYIICGEGPLKEYLRRLSIKLGIENQVILLGYRNDIADIYSVADVFAFPSRREGLGMAALEAMSSGLPLVTSNIHGIVDYSVNGETGFTCSPLDSSCFAIRISQLKKSPDLINKFGRNNVKKVDVFNINNVLRNVKKIYESL